MSHGPPSLCLSVSLPLCLSLSPSLCLSVSLCLSLSVSVSLFLSSSHSLDVAELETQLSEVGDTARLKMIVTDGVFSMDGVVAPLK